ncbi:MAG: hypothetical protein B0A82_16080 [Alkalinema sp. CACIAM 70d]|nr:MAG: hypothetical protein B0A82_16080 [Alkalinema sp. CACIAM 70d]
MVTLADRREAAEWVQTGHPELSQRRVCQLVGIAQSTVRYEKPALSEEAKRLRREILRIAGACVGYGYRRIAWKLRREGWTVNHKQVQRLCVELRLSLPRRKRRKRLGRAAGLEPAVRPNHKWAMDFVHDTTVEGRKLRFLTVVDRYTRECPGILVGESLPATQVIRALDRMVAWRGAPDELRVDNGPEFLCAQMKAWATRNGIRLVYIQPGKPTQNGHIESFNGKFRDEFLDAELFYNLSDARQKTEVWRWHYNDDRPHSAWRQQTPNEVAQHFGWAPFALNCDPRAGQGRCQGFPNGAQAALTAPPSGADHQLISGRRDRVTQLAV